VKRDELCNLQQIQELIKLYNPINYIFSFEIPKDNIDNHHCHLFLTATVKIATLRTHVKNVFGKGNRFHSIKSSKEIFPIEALAYIVKDNRNGFHTNYSPEIQQQILDYDLKIKEDLKVTKTVKKNALETFKLATPNWKPYYSPKDKHLEPPEFYANRLLKLLYIHYRNTRKSLQSYTAIKFIEQMLLHDHPDGIEYLFNKTYSTYSRNDNFINNQKYLETHTSHDENERLQFIIDEQKIRDTLLEKK